MSCEALWSVMFQSNVQDASAGNIGGGVVVLETDRVLGGDGTFVYIGDYKITAGTITVNLTVDKYNEFTESVFGNIDHFHLNLEGEYNDIEFELHGTMAEDSSREIRIKCARVAELPG